MISDGCNWIDEVPSQRLAPSEVCPITGTNANRNSATA